MRLRGSLPAPSARAAGAHHLRAHRDGLAGDHDAARRVALDTEFVAPGGFSAVVSLGDAADVHFGDVLDYLADPSVFAYEDGAWTPVDTTMVGSNDDRAWFETEAPVGAPLAVANAPRVDLTALERSSYCLFPGDSVDVTATLTNNGNSSWDETVAFAVDGQTANETTVSLEPGEETTVTRTYTFDDAGLHTISVDGETVSVLVIDPSALGTSEDETSESRTHVHLGYA